MGSKKNNSTAKDYLQDKKILILDDSTSTRSVMKQVVEELGAKAENINAIGDFRQARHYVETERPTIIITEFHIGDFHGLDLMYLQDEYAGDPTQRLFMVVTANAHDSAVADAAEEEVDSYILKPFSKEKFKSYMSQSVRAKASPTEYQIMIKEGKDHYRAGEFDEARTTFNMAKLMTDKPCLACYYLGQVEEKTENFDEALEQYRYGLEINAIHYRCLVGEFELLYMLEKKKEAYDSLKKITSHFPVTPQILSKAFLLSIYTYNYNDVDDFFNLFLQLHRKPPELTKIVSAGMMTAGKYLLREKDIERALHNFKCGAVVSGRMPEYLHKVIDSLLDYGFGQSSQEFLAMFEGEELESDLFKQIKFRIDSQNATADQVIMMGRDLIYEGAGDENIYRAVLKSLVKQKNRKLAETIVYKGIEQYPDMKKQFLGYLDRIG
jgi:CheY-like chemotaxis protein